MTDSNGLVYLQTRYYNPQLMRFMNRDTVAGSITDSQSLNRFSYVEGNPLTYVDLNGQARTWLKDNYELIHGVFLIASILLIPYFAPVFSALNLGLDLVAGHPENAIADALGILIPVGIAKLADSGLRIGLPVVTNSIADSLTPALATSVSQVSVKASDAGQVALWGYRAYSANKGTSEVASTVNTHPKKKPYSNPKRRPKYAPGQVEAVWEKLEPRHLTVLSETRIQVSRCIGINPCLEQASGIWAILLVMNIGNCMLDIWLMILISRNI